MVPVSAIHVEAFAVPRDVVRGIAIDDRRARRDRALTQAVQMGAAAAAQRLTTDQGRSRCEKAIPPRVGGRENLITPLAKMCNKYLYAWMTQQYILI